MDIGCVYIPQSLLNLASLMYLSVEKGGLKSIFDAEKGGSNPWSLPMNFKCSVPPPLKEETRLCSSLNTEIREEIWLNTEQGQYPLPPPSRQKW